MARKVSYFKIGLFVVVAFGLGIAGVVVLGVSALFQESVSVVTYLDESVQGLAVGAPIKIRGVPVGEVGEIALATQKYHLPGDPFERNEDWRYRSYVVITLRVTEPQLVAALKKIPREKLAEVCRGWAERGWRVQKTSAGIAGPTYLELVESGPEAVDVSKIPWAAEHAKELYIPATHSQMTQLWDSVESISKNLEKADVAGLTKALTVTAAELAKVAENLQKADLAGVVASAKELLDKRIAVAVDKVNEKLPRVLANAEAVTKQFSDAMPHIKAISEKADALATTLEKSIPPFVERATALASRIEKSVADDASPALRDLRQAVASVQKLVEERLTPTVANIQTASGKAPDAVAQLDLLLRRINLGISTSLASLDKAMGDLTQTARNLRQLSEQTGRYPAYTLFGDPPPPALRTKGK